MSEIIGVNALIQWIGEEQAENVYISYGRYNEESNDDGLGVNDDFIFYYSNPTEIESYKEVSLNNEWILIDYEEVSND
jgi:hypothetical protein